MTEDTKSTFGFQIDEEDLPTAEVVKEAKPPKRKPRQKKAVIEEPVNVKEEAEKLLMDETVQEMFDEAIEKPLPESKPVPVLKAPPVRPVLYGMQKVKRRMKERRNFT